MNAQEQLIGILNEYQEFSRTKSTLHDTIFNGIDDNLMLLNSKGEIGEINSAHYSRGTILVTFKHSHEFVPIQEIDDGKYNFTDDEQGTLLLNRTKTLYELVLKIHSLAEAINHLAVGKNIKNSKGEIGIIKATDNDGLCTKFDNYEKWVYKFMLETKEYELV